MGNKTTREIREKIELLNEDSEKRDIEWTIETQENVYSQMTILARYLNLQKVNITFTSQKIEDITSLSNAIQGGEILENITINAKNTNINDANILPQHINTLKRFTLNLSNTKISDLSQIFLSLNKNLQLEYINIDVSNTNISSLKLLDVNLFKNLKSFFCLVKNTNIESIEQLCFNLGKLQKLEELHLDFSQTQIKDIGALSSCLRNFSQLLQLSIKLDNTQIDSIYDLISGISKCHQLNQLSLTFNNTLIEDIDKLGDLLKFLPNLNYINIQFSQTKVKVADNLFSKIGYLSHLKSLSLDFKETEIKSDVLDRTLDKLQNLEFIKLSGNKEFSESILQTIPQQQKLKSLILDLTNTDVSDINKLLYEIGNCILLRHLQIFLRGSRVKIIDFSNLGKLQNLRILQLDVQNTQISKIIGLIEEVRNLKFLNYIYIDFRDTNLDSEGLYSELNEQLKQLNYIKDKQLL